MRAERRRSAYALLMLRAETQRACVVDAAFFDKTLLLFDSCVSYYIKEPGQLTLNHQKSDSEIVIQTLG